MQASCLMTLIWMNGAYLFISFNMDSMVVGDEREQIEEVVVASTTRMNFEPADLLDLDIFDFDVEELVASGDRHDFGLRSSDPTCDLV
jgi:hypothetical protein